MDNLRLAGEGAWKVLTAGLLFGAGVPVIFALGIRAFAFGDGGASGAPARGNPLGKLVGAVCMVVVLGAIALGLSIIVANGFGKKVSFDSTIPTFVDKK